MHGFAIDNRRRSPRRWQVGNSCQNPGAGVANLGERSLGEDTGMINHVSTSGKILGSRDVLK